MNTGLPSPLEGQALNDPALHAWLRSYVRRRVASDEADDLVQAILCAALESRQRPPDAVGLRRWLTGVARHLIARHYEVSRSARRGDDDTVEPAQAPPPFEERSLVRWAEMQAEAIAHGPETLDWMAREGEGEKLESIAREAELPSARVRQRVSRLRRWMKGRYLAELALASTLAMTLAWLWTRRGEPKEPMLVDDAPTASVSTPTAFELTAAAIGQREAAARLCERRDWAGCLEALDAAKRLDPTGDEAPAVSELRRTAAVAMQREVPAFPIVKGKEGLKPLPPTKPDVKPQAGRIDNGTPVAPAPTEVKVPGKTSTPPGSTGLPPGSNRRALPKNATPFSNDSK